MKLRQTVSCLAALAACTPAAAQQPATAADIPVASFAQLPAMRNARLSPDGTHLAYIRPVNGRGHLVIQALSGQGRPAVVPPSEDVDIEWLRWANDDRVVFAVSAQRKRGLTETVETRLLAIDRDGSNATSIVKPLRESRTGIRTGVELAPPQIQDDVIHWLPDEEHFILVSVDGNHDAADEVRRIDIRTGNFTLERRDAEGIQSWLTDQDGEVRLGWGYRGNRGTMTRIRVRSADGDWSQATETGWYDEGFFPQAFTEDPSIAYMIGPDSDGFEVLVKADIMTGDVVEVVLSVPGYDVGGMVMDPVTGNPVGISYTGHSPTVVYFDKDMDALQRAIDAALPHTTNRIVSLTNDRRKLLIRSSSDVDAGTYNYLNRDTKKLTTLSEVMPGLAPELMSPVEPVSYSARDGVEIPSYLTIPRGADPKNLPVVVMPHGGPAGRDDKSFWFLSQFLLSRGYALFQPNFRGSSGYGRPFEFAGRQEWGGKMQEDVTDGTEWLIAEGIADPERICIVGWSYGGYSAAMGAIQTPDLYQCAASINGVLNLPRLIADDKRYIGGSMWTRHMGLEDENSKTVSPYHQAERINIPILIVQAADDVRVHEDQGEGMARRLQRLDKDVTYVGVELGGHSMDNQQAREAILTALEGFLARNLGSD